jgi:hypothetical protein
MQWGESCPAPTLNTAASNEFVAACFRHPPAGECEVPNMTNASEKFDAVPTLWVGNGNHPTIIPPIMASDRTPYDAQFVGAVAWKFGPGQERREGFFIARCPDAEWAWTLLSLRYDKRRENWCWEVRASTDLDSLTADSASRWLFREVWIWEKRRCNTDLFEEVEAGGLLDAAEIWKIGEETLI